MAEKKKFLESKFGKAIVGIVSVVVIGGAVSTMVACQSKDVPTDIPSQNITVDNGIVSPTNPSTDQKVEDEKEEQQVEQGGSGEQQENQGSGEIEQGGNQGGNQGGEQGGNQGGEQGGNQGSGEEQEVITEAQYKQMFLDELPKAIEDYYNENVAAFDVLYISGTEVKDINLANNKIYIETSQVNKKVSMYLTTDIFSHSTFEEMYGALGNFSGEFSALQKIVNQELADEIGAFALEQQEVKDYIAENVGTYSNYSVISASEFKINEIGDDQTNLVVRLGDKILNFSVSGTAVGSQSTQEQIFKAIKHNVSFKFGNIEKYQGMGSEDEVDFTEALIAEITSDAYINEHFENTGTGMAMKNFELGGRTNSMAFELDY